MSLCVSIRPVYVSVCALVCVPSCGAEAMGAVAGDRGCGSYGGGGGRPRVSAPHTGDSKREKRTEDDDMPLRGPAWATGPTTGGSPLPCGRRPPFAATAPSADAVGRYQRRGLPRSMVSFTKRGSRSRTDPPVTKARLAHTHTHTHARTQVHI